MSYIEEFCDSIAIINAGKVAISGDLHEIKRNYVRDKLVVSTTNPEQIKADLGNSCFKRDDGTLLIQLGTPDEKQAMMKIILPQAVRNILPALGNEFIMMLKETSLASTFFLGDLMTSYAIVKGVTYLTLEPMTIVAIIYLCMTFPLSKIVEKFEKKMANPNSYKKHKKLINGGKK